MESRGVDRGTAGEEKNRASIVNVVATRTRLYVIDLVGGPSRVRVFDHHGKPLADLPPPKGAPSLDGVLRMEGDADDVYATAGRLLRAGRLDAAAAQLRAAEERNRKLLEDIKTQISERRGRREAKKPRK